MLVLAGMAFFFSSPLYAGYVLMGVYTTHQAASDACKAHRNHPATNQLCHAASNTLDGTLDACSLQDILYHDGDSGNYGVPGIWPDRYAFISTEDCGGQCPQGQQPIGPGGLCVAQSSCPVGEKEKFHSDTAELMPTDVCSNGCWYTAVQDQMVMMDIDNGGWVSEFTSTGEQCALQAGESGGGGPPENCIIDSQGNYFCPGDTQPGAAPNCIAGGGFEACIDQQDPQNCGYINNYPVCFNDVPEGECMFIPGGSYICASDNPDPFQFPTPPGPNAGTPGIPATPDVTMSGDNPDGPDHYFYYDETTVNNSSGTGGAPGPGSYGDGQGGCQPGSPECPAHVDETGVPESSGTPDNQRFEEAPTGLEGLADELTDIGSGSTSIMADPPASLVDLDGLFPPVAACQNPSLAFFGQQISFDICEELAWLRDFMAWVFYLLTAFGIFQIAMDLRGIG